MKIKRIEHVAIAVKSIKAMRDIFENKLGIEIIRAASARAQHQPCHVPNRRHLSLELLQSDKPGTGTSRWIAEHGEGLLPHPPGGSRTSRAAWPKVAEQRHRRFKLKSPTPPPTGIAERLHRPEIDRQPRHRTG